MFDSLEALKIPTILLVAAAVTPMGATLKADILADYKFNGGSSAVTTSAANVTASNFSFATGFTTNTGFSSTGENIFARVNGTSASTLAGAITDNDYVTVTIDANSSYALNLTSLTVDYGYSLNATSVPGGVGKSLSASVFSSIGGFSAANALGTKTFTAADQGSGNFWDSFNIDLTGSAFQNLSAPISFRIYFYDNENTLTQPIHRIDNFTLNGTVVPEPSSALAGGLVLFGLVRRRRAI